MLNNSVVAASMVASFKHNDQTSKSNIELFIYIIVYITEFEAVILLQFRVTASLLYMHVCVAWYSCVQT